MWATPNSKPMNSSPTLIRQNNVPSITSLKWTWCKILVNYWTFTIACHVELHVGVPFIPISLVPSALELQCKVYKGRSQHSLPMREYNFWWSQALHTPLWSVPNVAQLQHWNEEQTQLPVYSPHSFMLFTCITCSYSCCNNYNPHLKTHMPFKLMYKLSLMWQRDVQIKMFTKAFGLTFTCKPVALVGFPLDDELLAVLCGGDVHFGP